MKGEKYLIRGQINIQPDGVSDLPNNVFINVMNSEGTVIDSANANLVSDGNGEKNAASYEYSVWATPGQKLTFAPLDSRYVY